MVRTHGLVGIQPIAPGPCVGGLCLYLSFSPRCSPTAPPPPPPGSAAEVDVPQSGTVCNVWEVVRIYEHLFYPDSMHEVSGSKVDDACSSAMPVCPEPWGGHSRQKSGRGGASARSLRASVGLCRGHRGLGVRFLTDTRCF